MTRVLSNHVLVRLEMVLESGQDRCMVCAKRTIGSEIVFDAPNVTTSDEGQVEAHFGPIEHSANLDARLVHGSRLTYHRLRNRFGRTRCNSYVTWVMWNLTSFTLEIVLVSV